MLIIKNDEHKCCIWLKIRTPWEIKSGIILEREKGGIHTILHIPKSDIHNASVLVTEAACARLHGYVAHGTLDNVHIHSS